MTPEKLGKAAVRRWGACHPPAQRAPSSPPSPTCHSFKLPSSGPQALSRLALPLVHLRLTPFSRITSIVCPFFQPNCSTPSVQNDQTIPLKSRRHRRSQRPHLHHPRSSVCASACCCRPHHSSSLRPFHDYVKVPLNDALPHQRHSSRLRRSSPSQCPR